MRTLKLLALAPFALAVACGGGDQNTQPSVPSTSDMSDAGAPSADMPSTPAPADTTATPATPAPADTAAVTTPAPTDTSTMDAGAPATTASAETSAVDAGAPKKSGKGGKKGGKKK